ncbi:MAG TPA: DUF502 domain-containing protein [Clostridiales bacterium]|jgi:uncharacterized membrane protein|nr:DUF502 domain-containing protein [Clostridiales bacterium]HQP70623.1 DUF502 domain-containing protein [Clostridiales bacterium]
MKRLSKTAFSYFIQGLLALLPLIVTIWVIKLVYRFMEGIIEDFIFFIPQEYLNTHQFIIKIATITVMFFAIMGFGILMRTVMGKLLLSLTDSFFMHIPGLRPIYKAVRQVIDSFSTNKKSFFSNPVLIEYPSKNIWTIGFNTGEVTPEFNPDPTVKRFSVFIPTTPNPTSGFLMIVTTEQIRNLPMKTEKAMQFLLTGGVVKE